MPECFGSWKSVYDRFRAWTANGLWPAILSGLSARGCDNEYLMIDSTAVRVHAHGANPPGGQLAQAMGRSRSSLSTKVHVAWVRRRDSLLKKALLRQLPHPHALLLRQTRFAPSSLVSCYPHHSVKSPLYTYDTRASVVAQLAMPTGQTIAYARDLFCISPEIITLKK